MLELKTLRRDLEKVLAMGPDLTNIASEENRELILKHYNNDLNSVYPSRFGQLSAVVQTVVIMTKYTMKTLERAEKVVDWLEKVDAVAESLGIDCDNIELLEMLTTDETFSCEKDDLVRAIKKALIEPASIKRQTEDALHC